jgi:ubiquinone/menaquinone biosynthesis C-methylase UbiE
MPNRVNRAAVMGAVDALAPGPGLVAADIGFGGGVSLALLPDRVRPGGRVHGVDISRATLDRARRRYRSPVADGRLVLHEASMTGLPMADASVDAAMTVNTVYFVPDEAFAELARMLSPKGRLVVGVGDPEAMARERFTAHGFRIRPMPDLAAALTAAGLTLVDHRRQGSGHDAFHLLIALPTAPEWNSHKS